MDLSILYFKGSQVEIFKTNLYFSVPEDCFILANSADLDEMPKYLRPLVKSVQQKINILISQPKRMLWVLKRTISMSTQNIC